jgi:hypothetical protein
MTTYSADVQRHMINLHRSLSEKDWWRYAAVEAEKLGHGGVAYIAGLFGCDPDTIELGRPDVEQLPEDAAAGRVRLKGGGRKKASRQQPEIVTALREIVEVHTAGRRTAKSGIEQSEAAIGIPGDLGSGGSGRHVRVGAEAAD